MVARVGGGFFRTKFDLFFFFFVPFFFFAAFFAPPFIAPEEGGRGKWGRSSSAPSFT